jgi:hypothetical protein
VGFAWQIIADYGLIRSNPEGDIKHQIPDTKLQISTKSQSRQARDQIPNKGKTQELSMAHWKIGSWNLFGIWGLEFFSCPGGLQESKLSYRRRMITGET